MSCAGATTRRALATFYFLFFALVGCILPFWGLYLQNLGFNAEEIGGLLAGFSTIRIIAPNLWAHWAGYFDSPLQMARLAGAMAPLLFCLIWLADGFWQVLLVMLGYGFFWSAMLPQYEVMTMAVIANRVEDYSQIRLWGSVGFVIVVLLLGTLFDMVHINWLPVIMLLLMLAILSNTYKISVASKPKDEKKPDISFFGTMASPAVIAFLVVNVLLQVSHGPLYTFYSIYLDQHDYSATVIGGLWALGVAAEVALFWKIRWFLAWLSLRQWLLLSLLLTSVRWLLIAWVPESWLVLVLAQLFHAFSFAMLHAVCIRYVPVLFPNGLQERGQALFSAAGFGLGGALGAWTSGLLWEALGGSLVFMLAALSSLTALVVAWKGLNVEIQN
ncbi:MAG: MFS transporter [Oceanobacter sp.]